MTSISHALLVLGAALPFAAVSTPTPSAGRPAGRPAIASATRDEPRGRLVVLFSGLLFLLLPQTVLGLVLGLVAVVSPGSGPLAAYGATILAVAVLGAADMGFDGPGWSVPVIAGCVGCASLWLALRRRDRTAAWHSAMPAVLAGAATVVTLAPMRGVAYPTATWPDEPALQGAGVLLLAAGAAALALPRRRWDVGLGLAAAGAAAAGAYALAPVLSPAGPIAWGAGPASPAAVVRVAGTADLLLASPGGSRFTVRRTVGDYVHGRRAEIVAGEFATGAVRTYPGEGAAYLDERRLVLLDRANDSVRVSLVRADSAAPAAWRKALPDRYGTLHVDVARGTWSVEAISTAGAAGLRMVYTGRLDGSGTPVITPVAAVGPPWYDMGGGTVLGWAKRGHAPWPFDQILDGPSAGRRWTVSRGRGSRTEGLVAFAIEGLTCRQPEDGHLACVVASDERSALWDLDGAGRPRRLLTLFSAFTAADVTARRLAGVDPGGDALIADLATHRGYRITAPSHDGFVDVALVPGGVALLANGPRGSTVYLYRLPAASSAGRRTDAHLPDVPAAVPGRSPPPSLPRTSVARSPRRSER